MHGSYAANMAVSGCDLLLAFGVRFDERSTAKASLFAPAARIVHFNVEPGEINKIIPVQVAVPGDLQESLPFFAGLVEPLAEAVKEQTAPWREQGEEMKREVPCSAHGCTGGISPETALKQAAARAPQDTLVVTDVGQHQMWAAQYIRHTKSRGFITSGGLGTMGFGYGAAIGAQMALGREQRVVMFTGDGSFHMNLNEACTAVSYELPIITVIFNNSVLGMVRQWQTTFYEKRYSQTDPHRRTDFVKLAEGFGLKGYRCTNLPEFQAAFADALKQKGPTWIECIIDKDEKVLPMIPGGGDINDIIME